MRFIRMAAMAVFMPCIMGRPASAQLVGTGTGGNAFPFGASTGTIYQQVYASSDFASGPQFVNAFQFFFFPEGGPALSTAVYNIFLSTTSAAVDGLNTVNLDANRGADNTLFGTFALGGVAPSILVFAGTPFVYDPSAGNLLIDMRISGQTTIGTAAFWANNGDAGGVYSRVYNFGTGTSGFGLQTEFLTTPVTAIPEPATLALVATGLVALGLIRRRKQPVV
jgi:hypothetical protein